MMTHADPPANSVLRLGTRRSTLAITQSRWVADLLRGRGHAVELVEIATLGDTSAAPLTELAGTSAGVFAAAIRRALLEGRIDLAVHSLKDLPVDPVPGLVIGAIPLREDPRDVLVARDGLTLGELPEGARIGTGSPRRIAQIAAAGLGLACIPIRGNVETRLAAVRSGALDAVVLARAGVNRLGLVDRVTETIDPLVMLPAPGQGALAVECRASRADLRAILAPLDDPEARACVTAERAVLEGLAAGCAAPVGALAEIVEGIVDDLEVLELSLRAFVGASDGSFDLRRSVVGRIDEARDLGLRLARLLREDGADDLPGVGSTRALEPLHPVTEETPGDELPAHDAANCADRGDRRARENLSDPSPGAPHPGIAPTQHLAGTSTHPTEYLS